MNYVIKDKHDNIVKQVNDIVLDLGDNTFEISDLEPRKEYKIHVESNDTSDNYDIKTEETLHTKYGILLNYNLTLGIDI